MDHLRSCTSGIPTVSIGVTYAVVCTYGCDDRRKTFAERIPRVAPLYARTTTRLATTQADTGLALGGAAGARHLCRHGVAGSRNTVLRRVRRVSLPEGPAPEIIGIDDWA